MTMIIGEVLRRNRVRDGWVYVQVTRGVAPRDHAFPPTRIRQSSSTPARSRHLRDARMLSRVFR